LRAAPSPTPTSASTKPSRRRSSRAAGSVCGRGGGEMACCAALPRPRLPSSLCNTDVVCRPRPALVRAAAVARDLPSLHAARSPRKRRITVILQPKSCFNASVNASVKIRAKKRRAPRSCRGSRRRSEKAGPRRGSSTRMPCHLRRWFSFMEPMFGFLERARRRRAGGKGDEVDG